MENWRDIEGHEGYYQVSDQGRVRSLERVVLHSRYGKQRHKGRVLRPRVDRGGYLLIGLSKGGEKKTASVHRLVLEAFVPRVRGKDQCNHKDGNKLNNRVENLEWCTPSENQLHAFRTGLKRPSGGEPPIPVKCVLTGQQFASMRDAARALGIDLRSVQNSVHENRTVCKKYKFKEEM